MNTQRVLAITKKELKKTIRDPAALFMIFLFPIMFVFVFGLAFGGVGDNGTTSYQVGVVDLDMGGQHLSNIFIDSLSETKIVTVSIYSDNVTAQNDLSQGKMQAIIIIPSGFTDSINSYTASPTDGNQWINSTLQIYLDRGSLVATQAIPPIIQQVITGMIN